MELLTFGTFRLNSRDYLRARVNENDTSDPHNVSSLAFRQTKSEYKSDKIGSTAVTVNVHDTTATDFIGEKDEYDTVTEPSPLESGIPVRGLALSCDVSELK